jgi:UDP-2,3-diacylglucosamine pyrophosphatase LpxH
VGHGMTLIASTTRYRTIWLSDIHLGTRGCKAEFLLDFLRCNESETLYLVGDIIDGWRLRRSWYWAQSHNDVIQKILRKARKGTHVAYIPGNHDEWLRDYTGLEFGGIALVDEVIHVTADGKRLLIIHGDAYDGIVKYARWLALLGDWAYTFALWVNNHFNHIRRKLGYPYWSLSAYLKGKVKNAVEYVGNFAEAVADEARRRDLDGVVCGHIHKAEIRHLGGILYCNDGDWVESCTALVEHWSGQLEIINWVELRALDPLHPQRKIKDADIDIDESTPAGAPAQ